MRVKSLSSSENWLVSASSDGHIKIWEFNGKSIEEKGECNTGCRCTSLTLVQNVKTEIEEKTEVKEDSDEEKAYVVQDNDRGCKVIIEDESETISTKKRKKKKNKNKNQKKLKNNEDSD